MAAFAELGNKLKDIYGRWSLYLDTVLRFVLAFAVFFWIRQTIGFHALASSIPVILISAAVSALLGNGVTTAVAAVMIVLDAMQLGLDAGGITLAVFLILLLLAVRFVPDDTAVVLLMPLAMYYGFAALLPVFCGLKKRPSSVLAVIPGVVTYYLCAALSRGEYELRLLDMSQYADRLQLIIKGIFSDELVLTALAMTAVVVLVYTIRQMSFDYAFYAAVVAGGVCYLLFLLLGSSILHTEVRFLMQLIGTAASCVILLVMLLLFLPLDFRRAQHLRFEDDDYYYYVKAVPKVDPERYYDDEDEEDEEEI